MSMLSGLSDQRRAAVALRYVGNFRPTEIAALLDTSSGAVRVQLHRAHNQLRAALENSR
jgi:DNA-directed RNA polymerase specialized sigma24 family protein